MAKAIVNSVRPKASATPKKPIPKPGNAAANTALPQPPNTNQKVPKNSASERFPRVIVSSVVSSDRGVQDRSGIVHRAYSGKGPELPDIPLMRVYQALLFAKYRT